MGKNFCNNCLMDIPETELCFIVRDRKTKNEITLCVDCLGLSDFMQRFIKTNFNRWQELEQKKRGVK